MTSRPVFCALPSYSIRVVACLLLAAGWTASASAEGWSTHVVRQLDGAGGTVDMSAKRQVVTESEEAWANWHRIVAVPSMVYMPERDRLLMSVNLDMPHHAAVITSDDHGATWSQPQFVHVDTNSSPDVGLVTSTTYLGEGRVVVNAGNNRWFSQDYGATWGNPVAVAAASDGRSWYDGWSPMVIDRNAQTGSVTRLLETGYTAISLGHQQAFFRTSADLGTTWTADVQPPQWQGVSEVAMTRAANGDLVAACRTDAPAEYAGQLDHFEGLGVSVSKDDGATWSTVNKLYDFGRHHASMLVMPNNDIVMTYVVRRGYEDTPEGYPQFGIEAVVSHDNGESWDLDHRFVLDRWTGTIPSSYPSYWYASSQCTSSVLLPDGSILTAFGTGYRAQEVLYNGSSMPRDVGLVLWSPVQTPEPSAAVLGGTAVLAMLFHRWHKRGSTSNR